MKGKKDSNVIAQNRKARHDYTILETVEAGIVLTGTEIKSIRAGRINLKDGFATIRQGEAYLHNVHIGHYEQGNQFNHDPLRARKLLMKKRQIHQLIGETKKQGVTLIPLRVYIKNGFAKVLIGVAKGKKQYDKREDLKRKAINREVERALKSR
ncbi:SsrA-binding protein SmpB [Vagococcus elongatus]|uniref:SsrA-binding protein n=1 Tax=Vagococcus elongatus TaxID=180344 RepID=A0A430AX68_9ENTE|nr:SsrA-binding protein SmpB [Vagococcus elongatus]RSU12626.1 SsrA-binding protein [Vagococcus elongatus]